MKTNATIDIYKVVKDWKGGDIPTLLGSYNVWLEHGEAFKFKTYNGQTIKTKVGEGFVIMKDNVDLNNTYLLVDGIRYDIVEPETFVDRHGAFHHKEFYYK